MESQHAVQANRNVPPYVFAEIDQRKTEARQHGVDMIDLGLGNPDISWLPGVVDMRTEAAVQPKNHRYAASGWIPNLRNAVLTDTSGRMG